jgi:hypothetical protein
MSEQLEEAGSTAGKAYGTALVAAFAVGADQFLNMVKSTVNEAVDYAHQLDVLSLVSGESQNRIQGLQYAFASVGIAAERTVRQLEIFQRQIVTAAMSGTGRDPLSMLGLDPSKMQAKSLTENIETVANKILHLRDASQRAFEAQRLFGRAGADMLPILAQGGEAIQKLADEAQRMGAVMDTKTIVSLSLLDSQMEKTGMSTRNAVAEFARVSGMIGIWTAFLNVVQRLQAAFINMGGMEKAVTVVATMTAGFALLSFTTGKLAEELARVPIAGGVLAFFEKMLPIIGTLITVVSALALGWQTNFANMKRPITEIWNGIQTFVSNGLAAFRQLQNYAVAFLGPAFSALSKALAPLLDLIGNIIRTLMSNNLLWTAFVTIGKMVIDVLNVIVRILTLLIEIVDGVARAFVRLGTGAVIAFGEVVEWIGKAQLAFGDFLDTLADGAAKIPIIGKAIADGLRQAAFSYQMKGGENVIFGSNVQRTAAEGEVNLLKRHTDAIAKFKLPGTTAAAAPGEYGTDVLKKPVTAKGDPAADFIKLTKEGVFPFQEALRKTQLEIALVQEKIKQLGTPSTWSEVLALQAQYTREINLSNKEAKEQADIAAEYGREVVKLQAYKTSDPKQQRELRDAEAALNKLKDEAMLKEVQDRTKIIALTKEQQMVAVNYWKAEESDVSKSTAERMAAINREIAALSLIKGTEAEINKLKIQRLTLLDDEIKRHNEIRDAVLAAQGAEVTRGTTIRGAMPVNPNAPNLATLQRQRQLEDAAAKLAEAQNKAAAAQDAYNDVWDQLGRYSREQVKDQAKLDAILKELITTETRLRDANAEVTASQFELTNKQKEQLPIHDQITAGLSKLAQQAAGPLYDAFKMIQADMNPVVALFLALFDRTKAFADIMRFFQGVMAVIAKIFDALRPVLDLFLNILAGVVNVFITFYNILGTIIGLFGIHIQRLQSFNDILGSLNENAKPLVEIVHDLPTINEYNQGKWADLNAAPGAGSTGVTGLNQSFATMNTTLQTLIGVLALSAIPNIRNFFDSVLKGVEAWLKTPTGQIVAGATEVAAGFALLTSRGTGLIGILQKLAGAFMIVDGIMKLINTITSLSKTTSAAQSTFSALGDTMTQSASKTTKFGGIMKDVMTGIIGAAAGFLGGTIFGGGSHTTVGSTAGGLAGIALQAAGIPGAGWIAAAVGLAASAFGHVDNPAQMPDKYDPTFASLIANMQGNIAPQGGAYTEATGWVSESDAMKQMTGGVGFVPYIEKLLAQYGSAASAPDWMKPMWDQLVNMFGISGAGAGQVGYGANLSQVKVTGAQGAGGVFNYKDYQTIIDQFTQAMQNSTMNLNQTFGANGTAVTPGGTNAQSVTITIDTINGADPDTVKTMITQAVSDAMTQYNTAQAQARRTNTYTYAEY